MKAKEKVTRREFIATTAAVGACVCGLKGCIAFSTSGDTPRIDPPAYEIAQSGRKTDIIVDLRKAPDLLVEGKSAKIIDPRIPASIIIANTGDNAFSALSIACTHNGYEVEYQHDRKLFKCISFNRAEFACDGRVIDGPTSRALNAYPIRLFDNKLFISMTT